MAGELQADDTPGRVVYFLVRDNVGQIWNGATFTAYVTANLATYAITGVEQGTGSGFYVGTMPVVAAGIYSVLAKERQGGSPAESDPTVGAGTLEWNGTAVAPAVLDVANGVESGITLRQAQRLIAAATAGKRSGAGTVAEQYDAVGSPGTARIVGNLDASGNGTPTLTP